MMNQSDLLAVIAKPTEKSFEEEFNEYVKELPPVVPVAALIEILQEMETPEQKMVLAAALHGITRQLTISIVCIWGA